MQQENKNIHEGHRKRLRQRFDQVGLDGFSEHEILELILFQVIPRRAVEGSTGMTFIDAPLFPLENASLEYIQLE